jgi:GxxExxY protein
MMETKLLHSELTGKIIGAGLEVYNNLGQGFLESVYEEALVCELEMQKISFQRQKGLDIYYKSRLVK